MDGNLNVKKEFGSGDEFLSTISLCVKLLLLRYEQKLEGIVAISPVAFPSQDKVRNGFDSPPNSILKDDSGHAIIVPDLQLTFKVKDKKYCCNINTIKRKGSFFEASDNFQTTITDFEFYQDFLKSFVKLDSKKIEDIVFIVNDEDANKITREQFAQAFVGRDEQLLTLLQKLLFCREEPSKQYQGTLNPDRTRMAFFSTQEELMHARQIGQDLHILTEQEKQSFAQIFSSPEFRLDSDKLRATYRGSSFNSSESDLIRTISTLRNIFDDKNINLCFEEAEKLSNRQIGDNNAPSSSQIKDPSESSLKKEESQIDGDKSSTYFSVRS